MAVDGNNIEVSQKMWTWAEEAPLNPDKLKNNLLLPKDKYGCSAWHEAA